MAKMLVTNSHNLFSQPKRVDLSLSVGSGTFSSSLATRRKAYFILGNLCLPHYYTLQLWFRVINYLIKLTILVLAICLLIPTYQYFHNKSWALFIFDSVF